MTPVPLALLIAAAPVATPVAPSAAVRTQGIGSFDRLRVEGPFAVTVATGAPRARVEGEAKALERVELRVDGATLVVRLRAGDWGMAPVTAPVRVVLATPALRWIQVGGGAQVTAQAIAGDRADLSVAGAGTIAVPAVSAARVEALAIGEGAITLAGRTAQARLVASGRTRIAADALEAGDLSVRVDGGGAATARARYTARVAASGIGEVVVEGRPKCLVTGDAPLVRCGTP